MEKLYLFLSILSSIIAKLKKRKKQFRDIYISSRSENS